MRNEEILKNMLNENFVEVSKEQQEKINGGRNLRHLVVAYGVVGHLPLLISAISRKKK